MKRKLATTIMLLVLVLASWAQGSRVQNKPYIDLRPLHLGVLVGFNLQDLELTNVGPQTITLEDGTEETRTIVCDADRWNPGLSVGVLGDLRLSKHLNLRFAPTMHFGGKRLTFRDQSRLTPDGLPIEETQDLKSTYISFPLDLKFSAERWNNYRPYLIAGVNHMINLTGKQQDFIQLKRNDTFIEVGLGCDLYLPFFKLIPELKFCYSLKNSLDTSHANELLDVNKRVFANAVSASHSKMIVLTCYFE